MVAPLLVACSDSAAPRFVGGDASTTPDATGMSCTSAAQCDDRVACTRDICVVGGMCEHVPDSPSCVVTPRCTRVADCNDNIPCTRDSCLVDGTCSHTAQNDMCPAGQTCDTTRGCSTGMMTGTCRTEADCRDTFDCTIDSCGADGRCSYSAMNSRCTTGQVCRVGMGCITERTCSSDAECDDMMRCNGTERCVEFGCVAGTAPNCDDMNACTVDTCNQTGTMCTHAMNPTCMGMVRSGIFNVATPSMYMCAGAQVNVSFTRFLFSVSGSNLTVTPSPMGPAMMGTIAGSMFNVRFQNGTPSLFTCAEIYSLTGTFTDSNHFTGTYTMTFLPAEICGLAGCTPQSFSVVGTAM
jgi:hypothetical protein